jgi:hypothetical protein
MLEHLVAMRALGLVAREDLAGMSPETQERVRLLAEWPLE